MVGQFGLYHEDKWIWIDTAVLFGFYLFFCIATYCGLAFLLFKPTGSSAPAAVDLDGEVEQQESSSESAPLLGGNINSTVVHVGPSVPSIEMRPVTLSFRNLSYTVKLSRSESKQLLFNIDGLVMPRTMVALMGASGAGKSTLLDVLAGRKTGGQIDGLICIDGVPKDEMFPRLVGYVEQSNIFLPTLTVREVLLYNARMRLPEDLPDSAKIAYVPLQQQREQQQREQESVNA